jgi:hypothetical protein
MNLCSDLISCVRLLMPVVCGLETEVRTVSNCCCPDTLLDGNYFLLCYIFLKLFCLGGVAED